MSVVEKREMRVVIGAKDQYSAVMTKAGKAVMKFGNMAKTAFKAGALAAAGLITALTVMTKSTANAGDELQKMSLRTGMSVKALSELKHAAEISGTTIETFEKGVKTLAKRISDANFGLETYQRIFRNLNIEYKAASGELREVDAVFMDAVDAINKLGSETEKTAMAQELFGKAGTQLLPMIKSGKEGITALRQEAERLGITFTQLEADQAAEFNDTLLRLKGSATGLKNVLGKGLMPTFIEIMDSMKDKIVAFKASGGLDDLVKKFESAAEIAEDDLLPAVKKIAGWIEKSVNFTLDLGRGLGIAAAQLTGADLSTEVEKIKEELEFLERDPGAFMFFESAGEYAARVAILKTRLAELNQQERTALLIHTANVINARTIEAAATNKSIEDKDREIAKEKEKTLVLQTEFLNRIAIATAAARVSSFVILGLLEARQKKGLI